jgi:tetratricopeptide (TPR) repeat protein
LGPDHTSILDTINNLGTLYFYQAKLAQAETMYQRALQGFEDALGSGHTATLDVVNNLGKLYAKQGKLERAEKMYQRAKAGGQNYRDLKTPPR